MEKTRLGISVGMMAAIMYIMGLINVTALILVAGYVLICETDEWLRKAAIKAIAVYAVFALVPIFFGVFDDIFDILNTMINWIFSFHLRFPLGLDSIIKHIASLLKTVLYAALAVLALKKKTIPLGPLDK